MSFVLLCMYQRRIPFFGFVAYLDFTDLLSGGNCNLCGTVYW